MRGLPVRSLLVFLLLLVCSLFLGAGVLAQAQPPGPPRLPLDESASAVPSADRPVVELPPALPADASDAPPDDAPRSPATAEAYWPWTRLVYYGPNGGKWDFYFAEANGGGAVRMTDDPAAEITPDLAHGGGAIAYANDVSGKFHIWVVNLKTAARYPITSGDATDGQPKWSRDGSRIAFVSDRDGQPEIYTTRPDGSDVRRLTLSPGYDGDPTWSPDGTRLIFSSNRTGNYRLYIMNADGSGQTQINNTPVSVRPAWSPDGTRVAYSADGDGDGWFDIYIHTLDGRPDQLLLNTSPQTDAHVSGWSPDGQDITYTEIGYVDYQGEWYIGRTFMRRITPGVEGYYNIQTIDRYPFAPVLAALDARPPQSSMTALPATSPAQVVVNWAGTDTGGSGIAGYDVQVQIDNGPWTDWQMATPYKSAEYLGKGGQRVAFRARGVDAAFNREPWPATPDAATTIEQLPPQTAVVPIPALTRAGATIAVGWGGHDPGGSGITAYQVQYRIGSGAWVDWPQPPLATEAQFSPQAMGVQMGQTVAFRVRGVDAATNQEPWPPGDGDTTTTLYRWAASGTVIDNTGTPINGASVSTAPAALFPVASNGSGAYQLLGGAETATAVLSWAKGGYGPLPATPFGTGSDWAADVALPPSNNLVAHGGFEPTWPDAAWATSGTLPIVRGGSGRSSGGSALTLGEKASAFRPTQKVNNDQTMADSDVQLYLVGGTRPVALWWTGEHLATAERQDDGTWTTPQLLIQGVWGNFQATEDGFGRLHVIANRYSDGRAVYRVRNADGAWSEPETPHASATYGIRLAVGPEGAVHVVWPEIDSNSLFYGQRTSAGWGPRETVVSNAPTHISHTGLAVGTDGVAHVVWFDASDFSYRILGRDRTPAGVWLPQATISTEPEFITPNSPEVLADAAGGAILLWNRPDDYNQEIMIARHVGGQWQPPETPASDAEIDWRYLAFSAANEPRLLYWADNLISLTERQPGGGWTAPRLIDDAGHVNGGRILVDALDRSHISYWTPYGIRYRRLDPDGSLTDVVSPETLNEKPWLPWSALDAGNNIHLLWEGAKPNADLGNVEYAALWLAPAAGEAAVSQQVTIPADMPNPVLSFFYSHPGPSNANTNFSVVVGGQEHRLSAQNNVGQAWLDVADLAGQTVPVTFRLRQAAGAPVAWATLDDVSLGSAHPDAWLRGQGALALGGETAELAFTVGNRAGVDAANTRLSVSLPPELTFVSATPAPSDSSGPIVWELGALPAAAEQTVVVRVAVGAGAAPFSELPVTAVVSAAGELETHNNAAQTAVGVWRAVFLPGVVGQ